MLERNVTSKETLISLSKSASSSQRENFLIKHLVDILKIKELTWLILSYDIVKFIPIQCYKINDKKTFIVYSYATQQHDCIDIKERVSACILVHPGRVIQLEIQDAFNGTLYFANNSYYKKFSKFSLYSNNNDINKLERISIEALKEQKVDIMTSSHFASEYFMSLRTQPVVNNKVLTDLTAALHKDEISPLANLLDQNKQLAKINYSILLFSAAKLGKVESINLLVIHGANINERFPSECGQTILHKLIRLIKRTILIDHEQPLVHKLMRSIKHLIELGADVNARDMSGVNCLHLLYVGYEQPKQVMFKDLINLFHSHGANVISTNLADIRPAYLFFPKNLLSKVIDTDLKNRIANWCHNSTDMILVLKFVSNISKNDVIWASKSLLKKLSLNPISSHLIFFSEERHKVILRWNDDKRFVLRSHKKNLNEEAAEAVEKIHGNQTELTIKFKPQYYKDAIFKVLEILKELELNEDKIFKADLKPASGRMTFFSNLQLNQLTSNSTTSLNQLNSFLSNSH